MSPHPPTARSSVRPSPCPGLLRIVQALDGGICRVKLPGGVLTSAQAEAVALAAERCASGVFEVTNRSNLQIRGVRTECEDELIQAVLDAGLGPEHPESDDVRNLMLSPAAGLDPHALLDTRPLAAALLTLLQNTPAFHTLSPKFSIQLDGGEALAMLSHPHDIWFSALPGDKPRLAFGLAGCPTDAALGSIDPDQAMTLTKELLSLFRELAGEHHSRMRQLLEEVPVQTLLEKLQVRLPFTIDPDTSEPSDRRLQNPPGLFSQRQQGLVMVAAATRLGRMNCQQLLQLAGVASQYGDASLRLTPWQGVLLPNVPSESGGEALRALEALGLLTHAADPLTSIIACTGSAACGKGLADTKADALTLAAKFEISGVRPAVHLSGCARSCAAAHPAPFTLLAEDSGLYALYQQVPGASGFGQLRARNLDIDAAADWFAHHCPPGKTHA